MPSPGPTVVIPERRHAASGRGFDYHLTAAGRELEPLIIAMGEWGARWARSRLAPEDLDVTLLMWDMHRTVRPAHFPPRRLVVAFEFSGVPRNKRRWWLVSEGESADLCMTDPGYELDLSVFTDVRTMTAIWTGDLTLESAIASEALVVEGPQNLRRRLGAWLGLSRFARVRPATARP